MSLVSGVAFISLVTSDPKSFSEAYNFYVKLGFKLTRNYFKNSHVEEESLHLIGVSQESSKEIWLESFPLTEMDTHGHRKPFQELTNMKQTESTVIKIRLSNDSIIQRSIQAAQEIVFFTTNLTGVKSVLAQMNSNVKETSDPKVSFQTQDPLGNTISFTSRPTPFLEEILSPKEYLESHKIQAKDNFNDFLPVEKLKKKKKIAVMTSGGDSPGMCASVRAVVRAALYHDCDIFAVYEGYTGLVQGGDLLKQMSWNDVRGWLSMGGTLIGTARCKEFREREGRLQAAYNMVENGIDALIVCGGDGSLTGADLFRSEWPSLLEELVSSGKSSQKEVDPYKTLTIVGLVGSIDNDMCMTDYTIGAFSSLERICEMVDYIDATATSHSRAFVVEVMGRHCGWLALMAGISTAADFVFIPEKPPIAGKWQEELKSVCSRHRSKGRRKTVVIVAEGAIDSELNPITSEQVRQALCDLGLDTRITTLGHVQRGGTAVAFDRLLATLQGVDAVKAVLENTPETLSPMIGINENKIVRKPLVEAVKLTKSVATAIEAKQFEKAMSLRDPSFVESYHNYLITSIYDDDSKLVPEDQRLNVGIVHVGAPSSGLNAATRAAVLYCLSKGHSIYAIQNGFSGLIRHGSVKKLSWIDVEDWHNLGGSEIGTNRSLPSDDLGSVAFYLQKYNLQGLIIIGGFEAYRALHELESSRSNYPIFNMPMVNIPATVSNNVPGTEYSLGSDTCLNQLVNYCDAVKQSASATRRRVFVVEVQGGQSGYVASYTGLVTGAIATYTPESKINLKSIQEDIELLQTTFLNDKGENRGGKMMIRNEKASSVFTTELIADIIKEAGSGKFESRTAIPGHVQQGKVPSSMDRVNATRFAVKSVNFIEDWNQTLRDAATSTSAPSSLGFQYIDGNKKLLVDESKSAVVLGVRGSSIQFNSISELWKSETNLKLRKGSKIHWQHLVETGDMLSGRYMLREGRSI